MAADADAAGSSLHSEQPHACSQNYENGEVPERTNDFSSHFFSFRPRVKTTSVHFYDRAETLNYWAPHGFWASQLEETLALPVLAGFSA